jgi:RNA-directed DNA polymerase
MASVTAFLEGRLRLTVNRQKSAVAPVGERQFLGYRLDGTGRLTLPKKSLKRAKDRLRRITRRNRSVTLKHVIAEVNRFTQGWATYFRHLHSAAPLRGLDSWVRRKLRCLRLKHCKNPQTIAAFLRGRGVSDGRARTVAGSNKGWWRMSRGAAAQEAMPIAWFRMLGLVGLADRHAALNPAGNRRGTRSVCPVV